MAEVRDADQMLFPNGGAREMDMELTRAGENGGGVPRQKTEKTRSRNGRDAASNKRRCVSTACIACRRRKSKCDGKTPKCSSCTILYATGTIAPHLRFAATLESCTN